MAANGVKIDASGGGAIVFPSDSLNPTVARLGLISGLLSPAADEKQLELNTTWFQNPIAEPTADPKLRSIRTIPTNREQREELLQLFQELLGSVSPDALGIPTETSGRKWYPIKNPLAKPEDADANTGLYLVTEERPTGKLEETETVVGLGALHTFDFLGVLVEPYAYFPFLRMPPPATGSAFVLGDAAYPIELGIQVKDAAGPFGTEEVSFDGIKLAATVEFTNNPLQLDLVLLNLKLPNEPAADKSVNDVLKTPANEWVATGACLLVSQLVKAAPDDKKETFRNVANALLAVLGLTGEIPSIDWNAIVHDPASTEQQLSAWLKSILNNPAILSDWLNEWYCVVHGVKPDPESSYVKGSGSRSDPWRIELVSIDGNQIELTVGTTVVKDTNALLLYPGLLLASKTAHPIASLPEVGVRIEAGAELLEVPLPPTGQPIPVPAIFPSFHAQAVLSNPTAAFKLIKEDPPEGPLISIGAIQAGFNYRIAPDTTVGAAPHSFLKGIYPTFQLTEVKTRYGAWDAIDLLNFDELIQDAGELLASLVQTKLDEFFDVPGESDAAKMAQCCAAVLGVKPPQGYTTATWPVKQLLLNGPGGVEAVITDPLGALSGYYQRCLTTESPDNKTAWELLLPSFAGVLGDVGAISRAVTGSGTADDPWKVELFSADPASPAAYLEAWKADSLTTPESPVVRIGLSFRVPLPVKLISMAFSLRASLMDILLPDSAGKGTSANWLPDASAEFRITGPPKDGKPTPLVTPALGGISVSSDAVVISAAWTRTPVSKVQAELPNSAFFGLAGLKQVKLLNNGVVVEDIGNIEFSFTPTSWNIPDLGKFTQLFFDAAGIWILAYGGPFGVTLVATFGLSPDLAKVFNDPPEGGYPFALPDLKLPAEWPRLNVKVDSSASFFVDPWRAMRDQLQAVLGSKDTAIPMLRILGWSVTGTLPPVPDPEPEGTRESPWFTELTNFWNLAPLFWTAPANGLPARLGFGAQRTMLAEQSTSAALRVVARVNLCEVAVINGASVAAGGTLPQGTLIAALANPDPSKPLVDDADTGLQIGSARIGFSIDSNAVEPILTLYKSRLDQDSPLETIDLAAALGTTKQNQILESLTYALMKKISAEVQKISGFRAMLELLAELQFVLKPDENGVYGLNLGAWTTMIADPPTFLIGQMTQVLEDANSLTRFQESLKTLLGYPSFELPESLKGLPDLLVALELAQHPAGGYALRLSSWIELIQNPVGYLTTQGKRLLDPADSSVRLALVTALSTLPKPDPKIPLPDLPLTIENNTLITLRIPVDKLIHVGNAFEIEAKLVANLQDLSLASEIALVSKFAGLRFAFASNLGIGSAMLRGEAFAAITTSWGLALSGAFDENVPPPFDPVVFYPLPDEVSKQKYLETLGVQIPIVLVSSLATQLVNSFVIGDGEEPHYPVLYRILDNFGLTIPNVEENRPSQVQSLAGFFMHPWEWVISKQALGNGVGFDLDKVGKLLHDLPGPNGVIGPGNIKLIVDGTNGMKVTGLPFGTSSISFASDSANGIQIGTSISYTFQVVTESQLMAANLQVTPKIEITANMAFGKGSGVAVGGTITPSFVFDVSDPKKPTTLSVTAGYGMKDGFLLTLAGQFDGTAFPPDGGQIYLVPFGGLSQFQAGAAVLLDFAANQLIKLFNDYKADPNHNPLVVTTVDNLMEIAAFFGITSATTLVDTFTIVKNDPISWLISFFEEPKLPATLAELVKLFGPGYLNLPGFTASGTVLTFVPPSFPASLGTLQILVGQRNGTFGVWVEPTIDREWIAIGAEAGIGLTTPLKTNPQVLFTLSVNGGLAKQALPPQMTGAPTLTLGLTVGTGTDVKYFLRFYPAGEGSAASTLLVQLLPPPPHFAYGDDPTKSIPVAEWLPKFALAYLVPLVADIILQTEKVTGWLNEPLISSTTSPASGMLLKDWGLLVTAKPGPPVVYALHDLATIFDNGSGEQMSPLEIIEKLFFVVLKGLDNLRIVPIGKDGGIYITSAPGGTDATDYGLRLLIPDISIWGKTADGAAKKGSTELQVQLGKWLTSREACPKNWVVESDKALEGIVKEPGVLFYFVRMKDASNSLAFHPKIQLVSIGVDFGGANGTPLVNTNGFQLGRIEPRIYFSLEFGQAVNLQLGAAIECQSMRVPLGPTQVTGNSGNKNPVAQNLLASGNEDQSGGEGDTEKTKGSVNPAFAIDLAYVYDPKSSTDLYAKLFSDDAKGDECSSFIWIAVQRAFGPIHCQQVGFGWEPDYHFDVGFDGSVTLAGLSMGLVNLKIGIPVKAPLNYSEYKLDLDGLDISYKGGPVSITGGFLETKRIIDGKEIVEYTGVASLIVGQFGLTALGSYALLGENTPSLFVFALLSYPIGGPPYFFITGLAGGFGYNRNLLLPSQDTVVEFPFVAGALDPAYFGGNDPANALKKISDVSQPMRGQYWLAAGIKFTSFQMINAFALLTVSFGTEFELALIGLATIDLPITVKGGDSYTAIAHAGLQILVAFQPKIGQLAVTAALTLDSYVLDKACHLTGGFAFYVWFPPNDHAGEFVVTLGGYHPRFNKPDYYPTEPRVGFSWLMPSYGITIRGGCYFALTPTAVMAGGRLELSFQKGNLRAWLNAEANFLIQWKPFYYDIDISVTVGASYRVDAWFIHMTFSIELGAALNIWGPPTGGKARVTWYIISFTIYFGPGKENKQPLRWDQFDESFLPRNEKAQLQASAVALERDARIDAQVSKGLLKSDIVEETGEVRRWIINPQSFEMLTSCVVPSTEIKVNTISLTHALAPVSDSNPAGTLRRPLEEVNTNLGIVPMHVTALQSTHTITLTKFNEEIRAFQAANDIFDVVAVTRSVPKAMWNPTTPGEGQQLSKDQVISDVVIGAQLTPKPISYDSTLPVPAENLEFESPGKATFSWGAVKPPLEPQYPQYPPYRTIDEEMRTLMEEQVVIRRRALLGAVRAASVFINPEVDLSLLAKTADQIFLAQPVLAPLGGFVENVPTQQ